MTEASHCTVSRGGSQCASEITRVAGASSAATPIVARMPGQRAVTGSSHSVNHTVSLCEEAMLQSPTAVGRPMESQRRVRSGCPGPDRPAQRTEVD